MFGTPLSTFTCDASKLQAPVPLFGSVYQQLRRSRAGDSLACRGNVAGGSVPRYPARLDQSSAACCRRATARAKPLPHPLAPPHSCDLAGLGKGCCGQPYQSMAWRCSGRPAGPARAGEPRRCAGCRSAAGTPAGAAPRRRTPRRLGCAGLWPVWLGPEAGGQARPTG